MNIDSSIAKAILDYRPYRRDAYLSDKKVDLFLVLLGSKRACEWHIFSVSSIDATSVKPIREVELRRLESLFCTIGIKFSKLGPAVLNSGSGTKPNFVTRIVYRLSSTSSDLTLMEQVWSDEFGYPDDQRLHGTLSGFPVTAIDAFMKGRDALMPTFDFPDNILASPAFAFSRFALSREHWPSELEVSEKWARLIKIWAPSLYEYRISEMASWVARAKSRQVAS